jgi:hypothetical protein
MNLKFQKLAQQILGEDIGDPEAAASVAREHNKSLNAPSRYDDGDMNDRALRSRERNAGLEREDAGIRKAEGMYWKVYKQSPDQKGWVPVKDKEGRTFGAKGYTKANDLRYKMSQKPFNAGKKFALFNDMGDSSDRVVFGQGPTL